VLRASTVSALYEAQACPRVDRPAERGRIEASLA